MDTLKNRASRLVGSPPANDDAPIGQAKCADSRSLRAQTADQPLFEAIEQCRAASKKTHAAAAVFRQIEASHGVASARAKFAEKQWDILINREAERLGIVCRMVPITLPELIAFVEIMRAHVWEPPDDTWCDADSVNASYASLHAALTGFEGVTGSWPMTSAPFD